MERDEEGREGGARLAGGRWEIASHRCRSIFMGRDDYHWIAESRIHPLVQLSSFWVERERREVDLGGEGRVATAGRSRGVEEDGERDSLSLRPR